MAAVVAQPREFAAVDCARRQLGDCDLRPAAGEAEPAGHPRRVGRRRVEYRDRRDLLALEFEKDVDRIEPVERELLDRHRGPERRSLLRQPSGAGRVANGCGAVDPLRIPHAEPARGPLPCVVEE